MSVKVLALDLESTLISNALSADPRPGLFDFLLFCHERFERVTLFTTVEELDAREVLEGLVRSGHVPPALLARLEYVEWDGEFKDLSLVPGTTTDEILFVDDDGGWIRPDQRDRWISIMAWHGGPDDELRRVRAVLEAQLGRPSEPET